MANDTRSTRMRWVLVALAVVVLLPLAMLGGAAAVAKDFRNSDVIARNVRIEGVAVGGMDSSAATRSVLDEWVAKLPQEIKLVWAKGEQAFTPEELGVEIRIAPAVAKARRVGREGGLLAQWSSRVRIARKGVDIPVEVRVDREVLSDRIAETAPLVLREPRNADITVEGDEVHVVPGKTGVELDFRASVKAAEKALADPEVDEVKLVTKLLHPSIRTEDLQHLEVVLGSYTTKFRAWQKDRTHNLRMAIGNLGRAVVMPGDVLSFNARIGPRLSEKGWRNAPIFIDGEVEPSTGGGICQVATTVYNAALLANLDMIERHHHSRPVDYAPAGRDATVYWGQYDLKIRNSLRHPILILGDISDTTLTIRVLGHSDDDYDVEIERSGEQTLSYGTKEQPDPELEEGKTEEEKPGRSGKRVTVTRVVLRGGVEVDRERLHTDTYSPQTKVIRVGTKKPEPPVPPEELLPGEAPPAGTVPEATGKPPAATPAKPAGAAPVKPAGPAPAKPRGAAPTRPDEADPGA